MTLEILRERLSASPVAEKVKQERFDMRLNGDYFNEEMITNEFDEEFKKHQELSRTAAAGKFK